MNAKEKIKSLEEKIIPAWKKYKISNWIWSILFVFSFNYYLFDNNLFGTRSVINLIVLGLCMILFNKYDDTKIGNKKIPYIFSFIFSLSLVIGKVLIGNMYDLSILFDNSEVIVNSTLGKSIITIIGFTKILGSLLGIFLEKIKDKDLSSKKTWRFFEKKYFIVVIWLVIFICWLPAFFAYYPGILAYDSSWQTDQAVEGFTSYTKFHPPLHTYVWHLCISLAEFINADSLVVYGILQMLLLSFMMAKIIKYLVKKNFNNWIILLSILFFAINPIMAIFSMILVKDVYFTIFFILFVLEFLELVENTEEYLKKKRNFIKFGIITTIMCLFRNNAIYAFIICAITSFIALRKNWKRLLVFLLIPIILYYSINSGLYPKLGIEEGDKKEALSVPIQQIASVINRRDETLTDGKKEIINKFLSYDTALNRYNPRWADPVKDTINKDYFEENLDEFRDLWFELLKEYPIDYVSAFLSLNISYWYFDSNTNGEYARIYIEDMLWTNNYYENQRDSKAPKLLEKYQKVATFEAFEKIPLVSNIFSITLPFWLMMLTMCVLLYKKYYKDILMLLPFLSLWLTFMAGPTSNFRYIFPIIVLYPILIYIIFKKGKEKDKKVKKKVNKEVRKIKENEVKE